MKNKFKNIRLNLVVIITLIFSATSCGDFLDVDEYFYDQMSLDSAFSKREYVEGWFSNAFEHIASDIGEWRGNFKYASDDMFTYDQGSSKDYQNGNYSAENQLGEDNLGRLYEAVRKASTFLNNVHKCKELSYTEIADYQGQAMFLRAYAYWALLRKYGPVPIIPEEGLDVSLSYEELSLPRSHFDDVVDFIEKDLVQASRILPGVRPVNNLGRPTRGAALALRARVLLYAASPLFNGNEDFYNLKDKEGNVLVSLEYDESKWAKAAAAAKEVINLGRYELYTIAPDVNTPEYERPPYHEVYSEEKYPNGWADVDPLKSYKSNFDGTIQGSKNPELIFTRTKNNGHIVRDCMPKGIEGYNKVAVTQKQVDAYYMNDGRTIQEAETEGDYKRLGFTTASNPDQEGGYPFVPVDVSLMYVNREPRFYASIAFNGSIWEAESATDPQFRNYQAFYYRNLVDGKEGFKENCPLTGIGLKKYYHPEDSYNPGGYIQNKTEPTIRYAEILLIYAEALNELTPGKQYTFDTFNSNEITVEYNQSELRAAIKPIRMRAGIPDLDDNTYNNQNNFRIALKKERQIELFAENAFRYTDLRRWKDAMKEESEQIMGCNINIGEQESVKQRFYTPTVVTSVPKSFLQRMYLWPFPKHELKRNINLSQNPGWGSN